jgi:hypothetical protein
MCLILPEYAAPEEADWDHDEMLNFEDLHAECTVDPTLNLDVVTMSLIITPEIADEIRRAHLRRARLPADIPFNFDKPIRCPKSGMTITITIPRGQVTDM